MSAADLGVTSAPISGRGPARIAALAAEAEQCGFGSAWVAEANAGEAFSTLSVVAAATDGLTLGTGIVPIQLRTPPLVAMSVATLLQAYPDRRINLGLGVSSPAVVARWHGAEYSAKPIGQMLEFVTVLRACLSGEKVKFHGDFYQVDGFRLGLPVDQERVRILVAALNPQMLRLGGRIADGVLLNYFPLSQVGWAVEQVRTGGAADIYSYIHCGIGDSESALADFRPEVFSYLTVDAYANIFRRGGFGDVVTASRNRYAEGDRKGALAEIPLELVREIKCVGNPDDVTARVQAYVDAGVTGPVLFPLASGTDPDASITEVLQALRRRQ